MEKCTLTFLRKQQLRNQAQTTAKNTVSGKGLGSRDQGSEREDGQTWRVQEAWIREGFGPAV